MCLLFSCSKTKTFTVSQKSKYLIDFWLLVLVTLTDMAEEIKWDNINYRCTLSSRDIKRPTRQKVIQTLYHKKNYFPQSQSLSRISLVPTVSHFLGITATLQLLFNLVSENWKNFIQTDKAKKNRMVKTAKLKVRCGNRTAVNFKPTLFKKNQALLNSGSMSKVLHPVTVKYAAIQ